MSNEDMKVEVSEDNLSARLSGGAIHLLSDALVSCFKGSGAINHLECNFEDPEDNEQYTLLMQKKSGISQGEKIAGLEQEVAELRGGFARRIEYKATMATSGSIWRQSARELSRNRSVAFDG